MDLPMPREAPVTKAILLANLNMGSSLIVHAYDDDDPIGKWNRQGPEN